MFARWVLSMTKATRHEKRFQNGGRVSYWPGALLRGSLNPLSAHGLRRCDYSSTESWECLDFTLASIARSFIHMVQALATVTQLSRMDSLNPGKLGTSREKPEVLSAFRWQRPVTDEIIWRLILLSVASYIRQIESRDSFRERQVRFRSSANDEIFCGTARVRVMFSFLKVSLFPPF